MCPHVASQTLPGFQLFSADLTGKLRLFVKCYVVSESVVVASEITVRTLSSWVIRVNLHLVVFHGEFNHAGVAASRVITFLLDFQMMSSVVNHQLCFSRKLLGTFVTVVEQRYTIWELCHACFFQLFPQMVAFVFSQMASNTSLVVTF